MQLGLGSGGAVTIRHIYSRIVSGSRSNTIQCDSDLFISSIASTWSRRLENDAAAENLQNEITS